LVLKGKDASSCKFTIIPIAFIMWGAVASPTWLLFVVLLNSVIHTLILYLSSRRSVQRRKSSRLATWTKATGQFLNRHRSAPWGSFSWAKAVIQRVLDSCWHACILT
jgi:hypothetical protein